MSLARHVEFFTLWGFAEVPLIFPPFGYLRLTRQRA